MKAFTIYTDSWHYRFLYWWHVKNGMKSGRDLQSWDFCTYWRKLLFTALHVMLVGVTLGALAGAVCVIIGGMVWTFFKLIVLQQPTPGGVITFALVELFLCVALWAKVRERKIEERKRTGAPILPPQPSIVKQAYRSWKDKFCTNVQYVSRS